MITMDEAKDLNHLMYARRFKIRGYHDPVSVWRVVAIDDAAKILHLLLPDWDKKMAKELSLYHLNMQGVQEHLWIVERERIHRQQFGVTPTIFDYIISGVGREEYPETEKNLLRGLAISSSRHFKLSSAYLYLSQHYYKRG